MTIYPAKAMAATQSSTQVLTFVDATTSYCHIVTKDLSHPTKAPITKPCLPGTILHKKIVSLQYAQSHHQLYIALLSSTASLAEKQSFASEMYNLMAKVRNSLRPAHTVSSIQPLTTASCSDSTETGLYWWMPDGVNGDSVENDVYYYFNDCRYIHIFDTTFSLWSDNSNCGSDYNCIPNDGAEMDGMAYTGTVWDTCVQEHQGQTGSYIPPYNTFVQGYDLVVNDTSTTVSPSSGSSGCDYYNSGWGYYADIGLYTWS